MKNKKDVGKTISFYSTSSPSELASTIKEKAVDSSLKIERNNSELILQLDSNHAGKVVYKATVTAGEDGGSYVSGEITTIPWIDRPDKKESMIEKIFSFIFSFIFFIIFFIPFMLIFALCYAVYLLFTGLFRGKSIELTDEEKLVDFMTNKVCCRQAEE